MSGAQFHFHRSNLCIPFNHLYFKVYEGEPDLSQLGEEQKFHRLGFLPSPFGTLSVHLHYRTKMELTPNPIADENETTEELRLATDLPQTRSFNFNNLQLVGLTCSLITHNNLKQLSFRPSGFCRS